MNMYGWCIHSPKTPGKNKAEFAQERSDKANRLIEEGLLKTEHIKQTLQMPWISPVPNTEPSQFFFPEGAFTQVSGLKNFHVCAFLTAGVKVMELR